MHELLTVQQVDPWLQFNPHIVSGYRPRMSVRAALRSFFEWHNESFNVWSHALAACFVLYLALFPPTMEISTTSTVNGRGVGTSGMAATDVSLTPHDRRWLGSSSEHLLGASSTTTFRCTCLVFFFIFICSVVYHLFMPCTTSESLYRRLLSCDVFGVVICITGTSWSLVYRGNACSQNWSCHVGMGALLLSALFVLYGAVFNASCGSFGRFKAIGFHSVLRFLILLWVELPKVQSQGYHQAVHCHAMSFVFLALGAVINALRFPEKHLRRATRLLPASSSSPEATVASRCWRWLGRFVVSGEEIDYTWNSHGFWHYCIILSTTMMLLGCYYDLEEFELAKC
ncbi:hypothetical protein TCSYLVIO_001848 [Trypanosoma cruzi]|nr:hypothetical protein TCSYLVIO_001848 [Trypanosoma cruzi]